MDTSTLKTNFTEQLDSVEKQIKDLEENLLKAKEYKTKLLGGLETLSLLENQEEDSKETILPE